MMKISWQNLKKCSVLNPFIFLCMLGSLSSTAATTPSMSEIQALIRKYSIQSRQGFQKAQEAIQNRYGKKAVSSLLKISKSTAQEDTHRYFAILTVSKLDPETGASLIRPFLNDRSWMIRSASLVSLTESKASITEKEWKKLLADPALVIRSQTVRSIAKVKPENSAGWLLKSLKDPAHFHGGKAQWVAYEIVRTLKDIGLSMAQKTELTGMIQKAKDIQFKSEALALLKR